MAMSARLCRRLAELFPSIMGDPRSPARILCGDGWYEIIERGLSEMQAFCDLCSDGGSRLQVFMEEVQERDGALCFYHSVDGGDDFEREVLCGIVRTMEISSLYFCEFTGVSPASLCRRGPRLRTLSYEVAKKEGYEICSVDYANGWREMFCSPSSPSAAHGEAGLSAENKEDEGSQPSQLTHPHRPRRSGEGRTLRSRRRRNRPGVGDHSALAPRREAA